MWALHEKMPLSRESPKRIQLRSQSEADSDIVSIQTGRVQRALQLDPGTQEACLALMVLSCLYCGRAPLLLLQIAQRLILRTTGATVASNRE